MSNYKFHYDLSFIFFFYKFMMLYFWKNELYIKMINFNKMLLIRAQKQLDGPCHLFHSSALLLRWQYSSTHSSRRPEIVEQISDYTRAGIEYNWYPTVYRLYPSIASSRNPNWIWNFQAAAHAIPSSSPPSPPALAVPPWSIVSSGSASVSVSDWYIVYCLNSIRFRGLICNTIFS